MFVVKCGNWYVETWERKGTNYNLGTLGKATLFDRVEDANRLAIETERVYPEYGLATIERVKFVGVPGLFRFFRERGLRTRQAYLVALYLSKFPSLDTGLIGFAERGTRGLTDYQLTQQIREFKCRNKP
jgi:hypothetical protein